MATKSGVSGSVRRQVMRRHGFRCAECGITGWEIRFTHGSFGFKTAVQSVYLSIDHVVPRSRGGSSDPSNLRVLCTRCNTRKGTR